jgi:medium-chain acyl-[acyl-carrier-protein] hydrolase
LERKQISSWLWLPKPQPGAGLRLYCLAHAGGGASTFASWASASPHNIEIAAIQLPGRETRLNEEPFRSFPPIARAIGEEILSSDDRPFAIFGHSAGAKLAIHVALYLQEADRRPIRVFLSGVPIAVPRSKFLHHLGQNEFIRAVRERFGALPTQITDDQEIWSLFGRPLRADLQAHETDELAPQRLLVPISVISGSRDRVVNAEEQKGWQEWSAYPVQYEALDVDHFAYRKQPQIYLNVIVTHLFHNV